MSDLDLGQHGVPAIGGAATFAALLTGFLVRFFALRKQEALESRAAQKEDAAAAQSERINIELALIKQRLDDVVTSLKENQQLSIKVALIERDVQSFHDRLDGRRAPRTDP